MCLYAGSKKFMLQSPKTCNSWFLEYAASMFNSSLASVSVDTALSQVLEPHQDQGGEVATTNELQLQMPKLLLVHTL